MPQTGKSNKHNEWTAERSSAELLFSLNVLNLCCHLWRQWWEQPLLSISVSFSFFFCAPRGRLWPWPLALACGKCLAIHTREEESLLCCRLLFCLINFYIRYTSLKMPRMCVCHCFGLFLAIERNLVIEQGKCGSNEICVRDFARRGNLMACKRSTACIIH